MTLRIASFNYPPYVVLNETRNKVWEMAGGIDTYVIELLKEKFCFRYEVIIPSEPEWGNLVEGRWTGVIGMVYRNEVDFGISNMMITESRYNAITFSVPYNSDGWLMISQAPRHYENQYAVMEPFRGEVWYALFVSVLISTCLLFTLQFIRSRFTWTPNLTWRNTLWNVVAVLCQEGVKTKHIQGAGIVYFLVWVFASMILQVSYGGTLIGFLTFPTKEPSISTLEELAVAIEKKNIKISYKTHSLAKVLLESHYRYGDIFAETIRTQSDTQALSHLEGFQKVLSGEFVYISSEFGCLYDSSMVDFTKLQTSSVLGRNYIAIAFSKKFLYFKAFNTILRSLDERGFIYKWKSEILSRHLIKIMFGNESRIQSVEDTIFSHEISLNITHLSGAFLLLISGHLLAIFSFIIEVCHKKQTKIKSKKKTNRHYSWK